MIPIKLAKANPNGTYTLKDLWEIFDPNDDYHFNNLPNEQAKINKALQLKMFPTAVKLTSEAYSRNSDRTADYELERIQVINAKAKPEVTWSYLRADFAQNLLTFLGFKYDYKQTVEGEQVIVPEDAPIIMVQYLDFIGTRTIRGYLGQTIEGTLVEYDGELYWENFRIAFPER